MIRLLSAFGFHLVLVETVGAGQGDIAVSNIADVVVVLVQPETGDLEARDGVAFLACVPVRAGLTPCTSWVERHRLRSRLGVGIGLRRLRSRRWMQFPPLADPSIEPARELALLPCRVGGGERVLPEVDGGAPGQQTQSDEHEQRAQASNHGRDLMRHMVAYVSGKGARA
jgi:hypothetical protein